MKALFAGSRKWLSPKLIERAMATLPPGSIVVAGGAPGVDNIALDCARARGFEARVYPALAHGRKWPEAGPLRNQEMLDKEHPSEDGELIEVAFLFHEDPKLGKGTKDMKARLDAAVPPIRIVVEISKGR